VELKPGTRWRSTVSPVEVIVVRPPAAAAILLCGGEPMVDVRAGPGASRAGGETTDSCVIGGRYYDEPTGLEVLCTKGGSGSLSVEGRALAAKPTKKLPASD